jgi:hypothetical protein
MTVGPAAAELFNVNGRTDMAKLTVALGNFANVFKNCS